MGRARDAHHLWDDHGFDEAYADEPRRRGGEHHDEPRRRGGERHDGAREARRLELVRRPEATLDIITPVDFSDAQQIADRLRDGGLVVVDLRRGDPALADRLTDFCSGLAYALDGCLQVVDQGVLLLVPHGVPVTGDELADVREPGFFNRL